VVAYLTIITGDPNELVAQVHTRMPVILAEERHAKCLGDRRSEGIAEAISCRRKKMWPISQRVNSRKMTVLRSLNPSRSAKPVREPLKFARALSATHSLSAKTKNLIPIL
jgi:putative SOS response-associated peptidase YedK